jgi:Xaa-Pro aminopeptidase
LLIDAGPEYYGYSSDITRTYPVSGKYTENQKLIYQMVLNTQTEVLKVLKPVIFN